MRHQINNTCTRPDKYLMTRLVRSAYMYLRTWRGVADNCRTLVNLLYVQRNVTL